MTEKRALVCAIILNTVAAATFVAGIAGPDKNAPMFFILFALSLIGGMAMLIIYSRLKKKRLLATALNARQNREKEEYLKEFEAWLENFAPLTRAGAALTETAEETFTKFGGEPDLPYGATTPEYCGKPLSFIMQIDFSEINADGKLKGFPDGGRLYLFADEEEINDPVFGDGEEEFAQGRSFQLIYCDRETPLSDKKEAPPQPFTGKFI